MSIFTTSSGTILAVPLLDSSGNALEYVADAPGFYKIAAEDIDTVDFYLDYDGTRYMEILTISVSASIDVPLEADYYWSVGGVSKLKTLYDDKIESLNAEYECPTAYPSGEPIPHGTPHFLRISAGEADSGTYEVYVCVMARSGTIDTTDETEVIPDFLDVTFGGITIPAYSEPAPSYTVPFNKTVLASGKTYIEASTEQQFSKTYLCAPVTFAERLAIVAMLGTAADLIIDGTTYTGCYIEPPIKFQQLITGRWQYTITFVQHTSSI